MKTEYVERGGYSQMDSAEHEEYAGVYSIDNRETEERNDVDLTCTITNKRLAQVGYFDISHLCKSLHSL